MCVCGDVEVCGGMCVCGDVEVMCEWVGDGVW